MALSNDYPATAIAGIFSATQEARASKEAMRILNEARQTAMQMSGRLENLFSPIVSEGAAGMNQARGLLSKYLTMTEGVQPDSGLTAADRIAYQDAAKLLNEQMVGTGNLRSGAAAFGQSELLRRVVADAETRRFNQQMTKLQTLFGGTQLMGNLGAQGASIGQQGLGLSTSMMSNALNLSSQLAGAALQKGRALGNQIMSVGAATDEVAHTIIDAFAAAGTGGASEIMGGGRSGGKSNWIQNAMAR